MTHLLKSLPLVALIALGTPVFSQGTDGETGDDATPNPMELNMGEPDIQVGQVYVEGEFTDWEIRCIRSENGFDPCQLYQLLDDGNGNPVAEINIFPIFDEGQAVAGATVVTPLETLLTEQLSLSVDGGNARKYPFSWCSQIGCFSRMGFTEAEIQQFRAGAQAQLMIVPVVDATQRVRLNVSLSGFTAGWAEIVERMEAMRAEAEAAAAASE